jgi:hypothetical protein
MKLLFSLLSLLAFFSPFFVAFFAPSVTLTLLLLAATLFYCGYNMRLCTTVPVAEFKDRLYTPEFASHAYPFLCKVIPHTLAFISLWFLVSFFWKPALIPATLLLVPLVRIFIEFFRMRPLFNQLASN